MTNNQENEVVWEQRAGDSHRWVAQYAGTTLVIALEFFEDGRWVRHDERVALLPAEFAPDMARAILKHKMRSTPWKDHVEASSMSEMRVFCSDCPVDVAWEAIIELSKAGAE